MDTLAFDDLLPDMAPMTFCIEDWPQDHDRHAFGLFILVVIFVLPSLTLAVCYAHIGKTLCHSDHYRQSSDSSGVNVSGGESESGEREIEEGREGEGEMGKGGGYEVGREGGKEGKGGRERERNEGEMRNLRKRDNGGESEKRQDRKGGGEREGESGKENGRKREGGSLRYREKRVERGRKLRREGEEERWRKRGRERGREGEWEEERGILSLKMFLKFFILLFPCYRE